MYAGCIIIIGSCAILFNRLADYSHRLPTTWLASIEEGELAQPSDVLEHTGIARGDPR